MHARPVEKCNVLCSYSWSAGDVYIGDFRVDVRQVAATGWRARNALMFALLNVMILQAWRVRVHVVQWREAALRVEQRQVP